MISLQYFHQLYLNIRTHISFRITKVILTYIYIYIYVKKKKNTLNTKGTVTKGLISLSHHISSLSILSLIFINFALLLRYNKFAYANADSLYTQAASINSRMSIEATCDSKKERR